MENWLFLPMSSYVILSQEEKPILDPFVLPYVILSHTLFIGTNLILSNFMPFITHRKLTFPLPSYVILSQEK